MFVIKFNNFDNADGIFTQPDHIAEPEAIVTRKHKQQRKHDDNVTSSERPINRNVK